MYGDMIFLNGGNPYKVQVQALQPNSLFKQTLTFTAIIVYISL